jgi:hypothetical protein
MMFGCAVLLCAERDTSYLSTALTSDCAAQASVSLVMQVFCPGSRCFVQVLLSRAAQSFTALLTCRRWCKARFNTACRQSQLCVMLAWGTS